MRLFLTTSSVMGSTLTLVLAAGMSMQGLSAELDDDGAARMNGREIAGVEEQRRDALLDDGRAFDAIAGEQARAVGHRAGDEAAALEVGLALGDRRPAARA